MTYMKYILICMVTVSIELASCFLEFFPHFLLRSLKFFFH